MAIVDQLMAAGLPATTAKAIRDNFIPAAESSVLDVTAGTVTASRALIPDSNKDLASLRDLTVRKVKIGDSANDHTISFESASDEGANRTLTVPALGGNDTLMTLGTAQTVTGIKTMSGANIITHAPTGLKVQDSDATHVVTIAPGNESADRTLSIPVLGAADTIATLGVTNAFTGRLTTTDAVTSGTARVIGGRAYANVTADDAVTAATSNGNHVDFAGTYSIPASTLKANSVTRIRGSVRVSDASGTDTLEVKVYIGGTTLLTSTAFDPDAAGDFVNFEFELVSRAAPGAAVSHVGMGRWVSSDGGTLAHGAAVLAPTNLATNGALVVKASAKWSSNTASTAANLEVLNVDIV